MSNALNWYKEVAIEPNIIVFYRNEILEDWRMGRRSWYELSPGIQQYSIDHGLKGPRPGPGGGVIAGP